MTVICYMVKTDRHINSLESVVNAELSKVQEWLVGNKLTLRAKKSKFVIFRLYQKKLDHEVILKIFDNDTNEFDPIDRNTYIKYLGILIDSNLTWKYHISHITSKISKNNGNIVRLRHFVPSNTQLTLYRSLISPHLIYGLTVWDQAVLVLQKLALRFIYFAPYRSPTIPLFVSTCCLPISLLHFKAVSILMHDVLFNLSLRIFNLFSSANVIHTIQHKIFFRR